jgi:hypothetical protein
MSPGVSVTTATRSAPSSDQHASGSTYFAVGQTERGISTAARHISSLTEFEEFYGGRVSYGALWDSISTFFEEGGSSAYVARVVGASASVSTVTLVDRAGTPVPTLRIDALGPGAWATGVTVKVEAGDISGTFKITVSYAGTGTMGDEVYPNLPSVSAAVAALTKSAYVRGTDLASATVAPDNLPAIISATALAGGSDDRGSIDTARYTGALALFGKGFGTGAVAIPGQAASAVGTALRDHCVANRRIALTAPASGRSISQVIGDEVSLANAIGTNTGNGAEYVGFFYPWVKVPDGVGGTRTISPEGFVAACRSRAHESSGPARPPAGDIGQAVYVVDTETALTEANVDTLNDANVSPIAVISNSLQLYGWKSLSTDSVNYELLTSRDLVNYVAYDIEATSRQFVFRIIDGNGNLFSDMQGSFTGRLELLRLADQFYEKVVDGTRVDPGYRVDTSTAVNTPASVAQNIAKAAISIRPAPSAELVLVTIAKVPVQGSV